MSDNLNTLPPAGRAAKQVGEFLRSKGMRGPILIAAGIKLFCAIHNPAPRVQPSPANDP